MFDFIRNNTRLMGVLLALFIIPAFVLVGVDGYRRFDRGQTVATVDGQAITQDEWDAAHRAAIERMRAQQPQLDVRLLDTDEAKWSTLENLVRERVLLAVAAQDHLVATDQRLAAELQQDPTIASLRKPDGSIDVARYEQLLAAQGLTPARYEASVRARLSADQVLAGVQSTGLTAPKVAEVALNAFFERRQVQWTRFDAAKQLAKVQISDADVQAYYSAHTDRFQQPETVDVEYVMLDLPSLLGQIKVSDAEARAYYEQNAAAYTTPEERRASHILLTVPASASAEQRAAIRAKAQELLQQVRANPAQFASLARQHSQDPGSAAQGGDLSFFRRGAMVKPFEDAVFALQKGQISDLVESEFGFHIIQLTDIKPSTQRPFEAVKAEIVEQIKNQLAQREFAEKAETFGNLVYEQSESFAPVAEQLKLPVQTAQGLTRSGLPGAGGVLSNPKVLQAVFSEEAIAKKRNTEAIELGANQLISLRVTRHQSAQVQPLEQVKTQVREALLNQRAAEQARTEGEQALAQWKGTDARLAASAVVSRSKPEGLQTRELDAALRADLSSGPAWVGVDRGAAGYTVLKVEKALPRETPAPELAKLEQQQYAQWWASAEGQAYFEALQKRLKVTYKVKRPAKAGA